MSKMRGSQTHYEIILDFMERNGDLCRFPRGPQGRLENLKKWQELTDVLNRKLKGDTKPLEKWRKTWNDFKNNTIKKVEKIRVHGGLELTDVEKRVLQLMGHEKGRKRKGSELISNDDAIIKQEVDIVPCQTLPASPPRYFCAVETLRRRSNSASSHGSSHASSPPPNKRKKDNCKEMTEKILEFEREKEKMAHEREMARIRQNDQLVSLFGRIVNVFETLAPSLQKYLDRNNDG